MRGAQVLHGSEPLRVAERRRQVLIVDLNSFATFPTLAIGLLVASLRNAGHEVTLISPLANDVPASERERAETPFDQMARRIHLSTMSAFTPTRDALRAARRWYLDRPHPTVLSEVESALKNKPDVLLLSAYLQHYRSVVEIGKLAQRHGIPLILGGPMFNLGETAETWRGIPGLTALVGAEADLLAPDLVEAVCSDADLVRFPGVVLPDGRRASSAPPLRELDQTPVPDFTDFPWDRYRVHIIPIMATRGCQWNKCTFCSDVISVSGRTFRNRSLDHLLNEMREQARRHRTNDFLFLDLKLNSNPDLFRGIIENVQRHVHGAQWIGTVHVDQRRDNGLSRQDLNSAVVAGMRRVSFGLETASQRLLDAMEKGCSVEGNSEFIRNAYEAGLSVRATMFKGYPGETADDLNKTADFLEKHRNFVDRIRFNEFSLPAGTPIYAEVTDNPELYPAWNVVGFDEWEARARYVNREGRSLAYRRAKARVSKAVYEINRRPIRWSARVFDGLM